VIITIHQPEHLPWIGFFHKMSLADTYVLLDIVQFKKNNWQNRNRIVNRNGEEQWLTVPVFNKGHISSTIKDTLINSHEPWQRKYLGRIQDAYCKHPYYFNYIDEIREIINKNHLTISTLNYDLICFFRKILGLQNRIVWASELKVEGKGSDLLLNICENLGATRYISGPDGKKYLNLNQFEKRQISVEYHNFTHPVYKSENFFPNLSTLDLIMNHGNESKKILWGI